MTFWIVAGAVGVVLFALAWWTSGRSKGRGSRMNGAHEYAKGMGTAQGMTHNPPGENTAGGF
jgi:hypothetical protein